MQDFPKSLTAKFRLEEKIGAGGMGTIYKAVQIDLERPAAIKFLNIGGAGLDEELTRFAAEAKVCSQLKHPNVVQVYDFDVECKRPYIVFEYVDGHSLKDEIDAQVSVSVARVLQMLALVCDGLHHAHEMGVIHRDIKPANILINESGVPKVADFGLAKMGSVTSVKTKAGVILGTPVYLSPEQATEQELSRACDIYALGVVLYELLAGTPPIDGPNDMDILLKHVNWVPHRLSYFQKSLSPKLDEVVARSLEKDASLRYPTAEALAKELKGLAQGKGDWEPRKAKVRYGCRKGIMRRRALSEVLEKEKNPKAGRPRVLKRREKSVLASVSAELAKPESGRKLIQLFPLMIVALLLGVGIFSYVLGGRAPLAVRDFSASAVGVKSVALTFLSKGQWKDPRIRVLDGRTKGVAAFTVGRLSISKVKASASAEAAGGDFYRHLVMVHDLSPGRDYEIALRRGDGTFTLPVKLKTLSAAHFEAKSKVSVAADGSFEVQLVSRIPFRTEALASEFSSSLSLSISREDFFANTLIERKLMSIDGGQVSFKKKPKDLLLQEFQAVFAAFMQERRTGLFYRMWQGERGRKNQAFQDGGNRFLRAGGKRHDVTKRFWLKVEAQLRKDTAWFSSLMKLMKNYDSYRVLCEGDLTLREAVGRAVFPLDALQCMAEYYKLPANSKWLAFADEKRRPFPLRYERKALTGLAVHPFRLLSPGGHTVGDDRVLFDYLSPDFISSEMPEHKRSQMSLLNMACKLDLQGVNVKKAWLGVELRVPAIIVLPTVELNGKFLATYRSKVSWWRQYFEAWVKGNYYDDVLVNLQKPLQGFGGIADMVVDSEKGKKGEPYYLFHEVDPQVLLQGNNRAQMRALFGPSDGVREPMVVGSVALYLDRH